MNVHPIPDGGSAAPPPPSAPNGYHGRAFLYVLVASGPEDLAKVGLTHDPLQRWSSFHPRWFEAFDLDHSLLVETESRADAQAMETALHRALQDHHCPMPLTLRLAAGGHSEWYRGAYPALRRHVRAQAGAGHVVHWQARDWLAAAMQQRQDGLFEHLHAAWSDHHTGWLAPARHRALQDLFDAHRAFDAALPGQLPDGLLQDLGLLS
ncbi:MAG: GIY-YIG nuclease family protein [Pseudoxanthomonas suwonensis]|nr:GIY-YIG nuclease family protein [Pseudoxanthomonas suwonensis]